MCLRMCFIAAGGCCGTIIKHFFLPSHFLPPSGCKLNHHLNASILSFINIIVSHVSLSCVLLLLVVVMIHTFSPPSHLLPPSACKLNHT